jgi:hypothetical protein
MSRRKRRASVFSRTLVFAGALSRERLQELNQGAPLTSYEKQRIIRALDHPQLFRAVLEHDLRWFNQVLARPASMTLRGVHPDLLGEEQARWLQERSMGNPMPEVAA